MSRNLHPPGYWNEETIRAVSINYDERTKFKNGDYAAYRAAYKRGLLDKVCSHMARAGDRKNRYVYEIVCHIKKVAYVGLTTNPTTRRKQHASRKIITDVFGPLIPFRTVTGLISSEEAARLEIIAVWHYQHVMGYRVLNIAKAGGTGGGIKYWTKARCAREALKYEARSHFMKGSPGAYDSARSQGILDEICTHMSLRKRRNGYWDNPQLLREEALKYNLASRFERGSPSAFKAALRLGIPWRSLCPYARPAQSHKT